MERIRRQTAALAFSLSALALVAGGCGGNSGGKQAHSLVGGGSPGTRLRLHHSRFGQVIFVGRRVVYMFGPDKGGKSTCYGVCASAWPPVTTTETPAVAGLDARLVGTTKRRDGSLQVLQPPPPLLVLG